MIRKLWQRLRHRAASALVVTLFSQGASIPTHLTASEKLLLRRLARHANTPLVVEIGSYLGASAWFLAQGLSTRKDPGTLYCVDTWLNEGMSEGSRDTYDDFLRYVAKHRDIIRPLRGRSEEVASAFEDDGIGLLFIDGDHSYGAVAMDVRSWLPKLDDGGIIAFHDSGWAPGVRQVIDELIHPIAEEEGRLPNLYWARISSQSDRAI